MAGKCSGIRALIAGRPPRIAHAEGRHLARRMPDGKMGHDAGVQATTQSHAYRHVRANDDPTDLIQIRAQDLNRISRQRRHIRHRPVLLRLGLRLLWREHQQMPSRQLSYMLQWRCRFRHEAEMEVAVDGRHVRFDRHNARRDQGRDLGCEIHGAIRTDGVLQRLFTQAVAQQGQALPCFIPDRCGITTTQVMHEAVAMPVIQKGQHLAVTARTQACAFSLQGFTQFDVVVDLAIDDGNGAFPLPGQGLRAACQIDDAEPAMRQGHPTRLKPTLTIRPALRQCGLHSAHGRTSNLTELVRVECTCDSTHSGHHHCAHLHWPTLFQHDGLFHTT